MKPTKRRLTVKRRLDEVFARLDDDSRISGLNLNVVHLPESLPDAPINDFFKFCFHLFQKSKMWREEMPVTEDDTTETLSFSDFCD